MGDVEGFGGIEDISVGMVFDVGGDETGKPVIGDHDAGDDLDVAKQLKCASCIQNQLSDHILRFFSAKGLRE